MTYADLTVACVPRYAQRMVVPDYAYRAAKFVMKMSRIGALDAGGLRSCSGPAGTNDRRIPARS